MVLGIQALRAWILGLVLLYLFLAVLAPSRRAGRQELGAGLEGRNPRRRWSVSAEGRGAACGPKKEEVQRNRELPCLLHHTADRRPDHIIGAALASPGQTRTRAGTGSSQRCPEPLSFSRGCGFRSSQFGVPWHRDNAEPRPKGMLVGR